MTTVRMALAVGCIALALGCGKSSPPLRTDAPDGSGITGAVAGTSGSSTVGGGGCECTDDAFCAAQEDAFLDSLKASVRTDRHFVGAECVRRDPSDSQRCCFARPAVCLCYFARGDSDARSFAGAEILGNRPNLCDVGDRAQGCLFRSCEFTGCDPADATSCDAVCADVAARITADDAKSYDVERRTAFCDPTSCLCRAVHRIGDRCYATRAPWAQAYDCGLSDAAIIAATYPPPGSSSSTATPIDEDAAAPACD